MKPVAYICGVVVTAVIVGLLFFWSSVAAASAIAFVSGLALGSEFALIGIDQRIHQAMHDASDGRWRRAPLLVDEISPSCLDDDEMN